MAVGKRGTEMFYTGFPLSARDEVVARRTKMVIEVPETVVNESTGNRGLPHISFCAFMQLCSRPRHQSHEPACVWLWLRIPWSGFHHTYLNLSKNDNNTFIMSSLPNFCTFTLINLGNYRIICGLLRSKRPSCVGRGCGPPMLFASWHRNQMW